MGPPLTNRTSHRSCPLKKRNRVDVDLPLTVTLPEGSLCGDEWSLDGSADEWFSDDQCVCGA